ncbi:glycosyltransferase family 2 protein [Algibacter marinivivus]|uniref:Glycosyltransferase family 2 protein n=1 Tax=Algibacter marinivivus TaxID=2100723 RepID=A0A2U2X4W6_9FLAO|nr:glycosyltransferase family 2 protein [Algibacter marinivivus]PWH82809.1 glycosyltransferase family 2 protein [Algibacter marinivivus]
MKFSVSVIIPVYNGERFIEKAIQSALQQPEVSEVVIVNDGSTDNTLNIVENLQSQNSRIQIYNHKNHQNKGRSESRNLGIEKAKTDYIAFLDADDFYLEDRFKNDAYLFHENKDIDGVYNAIGAHFYREASKEEAEKLKITTITTVVEPEELFETLLYYRKGHFSIDGLTLKRSVFDSFDGFSKKLKVAEDTELFYRLALKYNLKTGVIDRPLAMRGVHEENVFNNEKLYNKTKINIYELLIKWSLKNKIAFEKIDHILNVLWLNKYQERNSLIKNTSYWFYLFFSNPRLLFTKLSIKYFPVVRLRQKLFPFLYKQ